MPLIQLLTNVRMADSQRMLLMQHVSREAARKLGKLESEVMVTFDHHPGLMLGGTIPALLAKISNMDMMDEDTTPLAFDIGKVATDQLAIPSKRVFIVYGGWEHTMWGWSGGTFL